MSARRTKGRRRSGLNVEKVSENPAWFAICTNPKQEDRAYDNLQAWGLECFNPKIKERRCNPFTGMATFMATPLFPRYIFSRFSAPTLLHRVNFARGVHRVVSFNDKPTPVDDEVIAVLKSRVNNEGFLTIGEPLKAGDKVRIKDGVWKNLIGVIERDLEASARTRILMTTIQYQGSLTIERDCVEKIS
jgi:transcriptional antiterminator RfaH